MFTVGSRKKLSKMLRFLYTYNDVIYSHLVCILHDLTVTKMICENIIISSFENYACVFEFD